MLITNMNDKKNIKDTIKKSNKKILKNIDKKYKGQFNTIHDSLYITETVHLDIHSMGVGQYYATWIDLFYKSMSPTHHINTQVTKNFTTTNIHFYFDKGVPFYVNHEQVLDFEEFLIKDYPEISKFFDHNKKEVGAENLISFNFDVSAYNPDNNESKDFKHSEIRQVTNVEELLLLYTNYMDSLFVYDNYDFALKDLFLIIRHSNDLNLN